MTNLMIDVNGVLVCSKCSREKLIYGQYTDELGFCEICGKDESKY